MTFNSDFADEFTYNKKDYIKHNKKYKYNVNKTSIEILKDNNQFNKQKGKYISIDFDNMYDEKQRKVISNALIDALNELFTLKDDDKIIVTYFEILEIFS